jgi:enamine deaminase RidA (YjgF/YER057c/UK114 family)
MAVVREVRNRYIDTANPPASTAIQVGGLYREGLLIEIDAVVVVVS